MVEYNPPWLTGRPSDLVHPILLCVAAYNAIEILIWVFVTFQRRQGLYFGSILTTTIALFGYITAALQKLFTRDPTTVKASNYIWTISHHLLLAAHLFVLYSRLHVVLPHHRHVLKAVFLMLVVSSGLLVPSQLVIGFSIASGDVLFLRLQIIIEQVAIVATSVREFILCGVYIFQGLRHLHQIASTKGDTRRKVMRYLIIIQIFNLVLDAGMLVHIFVPIEVSATGYCAVASILKLKMEFGVLNALVTLVTTPPPSLLGDSQSEGRSVGYKKSFLLR